jgi:hypothetical protein
MLLRHVGTAASDQSDVRSVATAPT